MAFSTWLVLGSLAILLHATVCAVQHREYLKAVQQPFIYSPFMISMQCIVAVLMGTWGVIQWQGSFMPIRTTEVLGKQTIDNLEPGPDFLQFNMRELR